MKLGLFELTVFLSDEAFELEVFAGSDRDQVDSATDRYRIVQAQRSDIVREILLKLERALASGAQAIDVHVQGDRAIVRDPSFPLPAFTETAAAAVVVATRGRGISLGVAKRSVIPDLPSHPQSRKTKAAKPPEPQAKDAEPAPARSRRTKKVSKKKPARKPAAKSRSRKTASKERKRKPKGT
jgi:hypothetical protein